MLLVVLVGTWWQIPVKDGDAPYYIALAQGQFDQVAPPFTQRMLLPQLVRWMPLSLDSGFLLWGFLALLGLVGGMVLFWQDRRPTWHPVWLLCAPWTLILFRNYYFPDLLHTALLMLFFVALAWSWHWSAVVLVGLLMLTRESTLLLGIVVVPLAWWRGDRWLAGGVACALMIAAVIVGQVQPDAADPYGLSSIAYLALKVPFNALRNLFGIDFWWTGQPGLPQSAVLELPAWLPTGSIRQVGLGTWLAYRPLITLGWMGSLFGILPLVVWRHSRRHWRDLRTADLWLLVALVYGVAHYCLGAMLGASLDRLVSYGWPAFWLAAPLFLHRFPRRLWLVHGLTCWLPWLALEQMARPAGLFVAAGTVVGLWLTAAYMLKSVQQNDNN